MDRTTRCLSDETVALLERLVQHISQQVPSAESEDTPSRSRRRQEPDEALLTQKRRCGDNTLQNNDCTASGYISPLFAALSIKSTPPAKRPHRLVVRTSRCGRDNPGSTPGVVIFHLNTPNPVSRTGRIVNLITSSLSLSKRGL